MKKIAPLLVAAAIGCGHQAWAAECLEQVGAVVAPMSFDDVRQALLKLPAEKGEYETTVAYQDRLALAKQSVPDVFTVAVPLDPKYLKYDADQQKLEVVSYAIRNVNTIYDGVFGYGSKLYGKVPYGSYNIDLVIPTPEKVTGTYTAQTPMGVKMEVAKVSRFAQSIFSRTAVNGETLFFPPSSVSSSKSQVIASFANVSPDMAKKFKEESKAAVMIKPKAPYLVTGKVPWGPPSLQNPREIDETLQIVVGSFQCALILNADNKVFAAIVPRQ
jgi:hypothetical protein